MLFRIKRTKKLPPPSFVDAKVHYATSLGALGNVTGWTLDEDKALSVDENAAKSVKAFHANIANAGKLTFEPIGAEPDGDDDERPAPVLPPVRMTGKPLRLAKPKPPETPAGEPQVGGETNTPEQ